MIGLPGIFIEILREAQAEGDVAEPRALLTALATIDNPPVALSDDDQANNLFAALFSDFGFLSNMRARSQPLEPLEQSRWAALVRWLIRELIAWRLAADPDNRKLVAIFVVAQANDWDNGLWEGVPADVGNNSELILRLKSLINSFSTGFTVRGGMIEPIWEREALQAFQTADREGDWVGIGDRLRLFEQQLFPRTILVQSVRCLHRCGVDHLADAVSNLRQIIVALQVASALPVDQRLRLTAASDNPYLQFGSVYQTISDRRAILTPVDNQALATVLRTVTEDEPRWLAWMHVFNAFPVRYPALQAPLGDALADAPDSAIDGYVNAIILSMKPARPDPNRQCVTECLRSFRAKAAPDRRALLWTKAQQRWSAWNFDQANPATHLMGIHRSDIDYAIVGFAYECRNENDLVNMRNNALRELQNLEDTWHLSSMHATTECHRILSRYQPYAQAAHVLINGGDWLTENLIHYPFDPAASGYFMLKYRIGFQ